MIFTNFSPFLLTIAIALIGAHVVKFIIYSFKKEKPSLLHVLESGGMPSAHSATVAALATIIGLIEGFGSSVFSIAALLAIIVMYDAMKVRRSSGEQGAVIKEIIKKQKIDVLTPYVSKGHTPLEVLLGGIFGAVIGYIVFLSTL